PVAMRPPFRFSLFRHVQDNQPRTIEGIDEFERLVLHEAKITANKSDVPLISPALYLPGETRGIQNVETCSFFVLDIDKSSEDQVLEKIVGPLLVLGWRFYVHPTHSYGDGLGQGCCKVHVILPKIGRASSRAGLC